MVRVTFVNSRQLVQDVKTTFFKCYDVKIMLILFELLSKKVHLLLIRKFCCLTGPYQEVIGNHHSS